MSHLGEIDDPRKSSNGALHDFREILLILIGAVLSDCDTVEDINLWARTKEAWLRRSLVLENGIPSEETDTRKSSLRRKRKGAAWDGGVREYMLEIGSKC
jgi:hypothetical protein